MERIMVMNMEDNVYLKPKQEIKNMTSKMLDCAEKLPDRLENTTKNWMLLRDIRQYIDLCITSIYELKENK